MTSAISTTSVPCLPYDGPSFMECGTLMIAIERNRPNQACINTFDELYCAMHHDKNGVLATKEVFGNAATRYAHKLVLCPGFEDKLDQGATMALPEQKLLIVGCAEIEDSCPALVREIVNSISVEEGIVGTSMTCPFFSVPPRSMLSIDDGVEFKNLVTPQDEFVPVSRESTIVYMMEHRSFNKEKYNNNIEKTGRGLQRGDVDLDQFLNGVWWKCDTDGNSVLSFDEVLQCSSDCFPGAFLPPDELQIYLENLYTGCGLNKLTVVGRDAAKECVPTLLPFLPDVAVACFVSSDVV